MERGNVWTALVEQKPSGHGMVLPFSTWITAPQLINKLSMRYLKSGCGPFVRIFLCYHCNHDHEKRHVFLHVVIALL